LPTFLSFGPDLPQDLRDGLVVEEEVADVIKQLATAQGEWPRFTRRHHGDATTPVFVNPAFVRFAEEAPSGPKRGETMIGEAEVR